MAEQIQHACSAKVAHSTRLTPQSQCCILHKRLRAYWPGRCEGLRPCLHVVATSADSSDEAELARAHRHDTVHTASSAVCEICSTWRDASITVRESRGTQSVSQWPWSGVMAEATVRAYAYTVGACVCRMSARAAVALMSAFTIQLQGAESGLGRARCSTRMRADCTRLASVLPDKRGVPPSAVAINAPCVLQVALNFTSPLVRTACYEALHTYRYILWSTVMSSECQ